MWLCCSFGSNFLFLSFGPGLFSSDVSLVSDWNRWHERGDTQRTHTVSSVRLSSLTCQNFQRTLFNISSLFFQSIRFRDLFPMVSLHFGCNISVNHDVQSTDPPEPHWIKRGKRTNLKSPCRHLTLPLRCRTQSLLDETMSEPKWGEKGPSVYRKFLNGLLNARRLHILGPTRRTTPRSRHYVHPVRVNSEVNGTRRNNSVPP